MALTDQESFGQVVENNVLVEKDIENYDQAFEVIFKRLDVWKGEEKDDQELAQYIDGLKQAIEDNKDEISANAAMNSTSEPAPIRPKKVYKLDEFKGSSPEEAIFLNLQSKLNVWYESVEEGILKYTIKAVQKFMHENKNELATSLQGALVEAQETEQPYTNGTAEKEVPSQVHSADASDGTETSKTLGGAPTDASTLPQANVEEDTVVAVVAEVKPSGKSTYRKGEKKDFIWYKDDRSKAPTEVPREQGVQASGITEFAPSKAKMDLDNPVPREMGVEESGITEYNASKSNKVDLSQPIARDEGVKDSPKEYIKVQEGEKYRSNLRVVLKAIKESIEI